MKNLGAKLLLLVTILVTVLVIHSSRERRAEPAAPASKAMLPARPDAGRQSGAPTRPWPDGVSPESHRSPSFEERMPLFLGVFPA